MVLRLWYLRIYRTWNYQQPTLEDHFHDKLIFSYSYYVAEILYPHEAQDLLPPLVCNCFLRLLICSHEEPHLTRKHSSGSFDERITTSVSAESEAAGK